MRSIRMVLRGAIEPAFGVGFVVFWVTAEAGRVDPVNAMAAGLPFAMIGLAIAMARLLPWAALCVTGALLLIQLAFPILRFSQESFPAYLGLLLIGVILGASVNGRVRGVALGATSLFGVVIALLFTVPALSPTLDFSLVIGWGPKNPHLWKNILAMSLAFIAVAAACWFIGFGIRAREERNRSEAERLAVEADLAGAETELRFASDRDRIAQDVHDIMAHSLSVIIAQADGARYLGDQRPETTNESLVAIAGSARESLVEVRMLIDSFGPESEGHSHPTLHELDALLQRMRSAGLAVTHTVFGNDGVLSTGQQLAVYRIVQESLTNALKHGGTSAEAQLVFDWRGPGLSLTVSSRGNGSQPVDDSPTRGVRGMHERARLAGGWLAAGPDDEEPGRFIVTGFVPRVDAILCDSVPASGISS